METKPLEKIGLTKNEIKVYLYLLKSGVSTTGPIMKNLGLSSSRVYASLQELIKKGLVTYFIKNNSKNYQAENPDYIVKFIDDLKQDSLQVIKELNKIKVIKKPEQYNAIFEGFHGFKQAFEILSNELTKNEELYTIGFSPIGKGFQTLRNYLRNFDMQRNRRKIPMKIILDVNMKGTIGKDRKKEKYTQVRYLPKGYMTPAALSIFKDYVIHWVWTEKITIFIIKNKEVSDSFRTYFNLLWKIAKK